MGTIGGMDYTNFAKPSISSPPNPGAPNNINMPINLLADYLQAGLAITDVCLMVDLRGAANSPRKFGVDILDKIIAKKALTPSDCQLTESESNECPEFATSKAKANSTGATTASIANTSLAIAKLCSYITDKPTREAINTKLDNSNFARAKVKAFFEDIIFTAPDDKFIGYNTNIAKINVDIIKAWDIVFLAKGTLKYKLDFVLLEQIVTMQNNTVLMQKLGGNAGLIDIIAKNIRAGCNTCRNNQSYLNQMAEYLKDVEYFVTAFGKNTGGNQSAAVFSSGITSNAKAQVSGAIYMLKVLRQNTNIMPSKFEDTLTRAGGSGCGPDARIGSKILEFKSWTPYNADEDEEDALLRYDKSKSSFWNFSHGYSSYGQFLCYLSNIGSMADLEYYFDRDYLINKGQTDPDTYVKGIFKTLFTNKTDEVFNTIWANNLGLAQSLFGNRLESAAKTYFTSTLVPDLTSDLYKFTKTK